MPPRGPIKSTVVNWDAELDGRPQIELADGSKLRTLAECRTYIGELSLHEQRQIAWRGAAAAIAKAAELGGPHLGIAHAAIRRALAHVPSVKPGSTKERKLAAQRARRQRAKGAS